MTKPRYRYKRIKKKEKQLKYVNKEYLETHIIISVEMDEMWSFYHDKRHQIWLWWAIDHETGRGKRFLVWEEGT
jgi:hypothetical protein